MTWYTFADELLRGHALSSFVAPIGTGLRPERNAQKGSDSGRPEPRRW